MHKPATENDKCGSDHVPREYSNESMTLNQQKQNRCRAPLNGRSMTWPKCSMKPLAATGVSNYRLTALDLNSGTDTSSSWQQQNKERFNVSLSALAVERTNRRLFFSCLFRQSGSIPPTPGPICFGRSQKNIEKFHLQPSQRPS